jgi:hypothetical protein
MGIMPLYIVLCTIWYYICLNCNKIKVIMIDEDKQKDLNIDVKRL